MDTQSEKQVAPLAKKLGKKGLLASLEMMLRIRHLETRGEAAYRQGKVGGFYHAYTGQEAVQVALIDVFGKDNWISASYRCHALALLLGVTPLEIFAELFGRATGNAGGRGGSMHLYTDRLLGGAGIVGGQIPIGTGAAFSIKYKKEDRFAITILGDGAVAQGSYHESLNLASLWSLPCLYLIENNQWGMGTAVDRALSIDKLAEDTARTYGMKGYTLQGMDYFELHDGFSKIFAEMKKERRPVVVEVMTQRFKGHSISDPALYRSKEELEEAKKHDPIVLLRHHLEELGMLDEEGFKALDKQVKDEIIEAMAQADKEPWPDLSTLEEGVMAP